MNISHYTYWVAHNTISSINSITAPQASLAKFLPAAFRRHKVVLLHEIQGELDEHLAQIAELVEHNKRLQGEQLAVIDQLRKEQERTAQVDKQRSTLETHVKDLEVQLEEIEISAAKNVKKVTHKLEQRVSELEGLVEAEQRRTEDSNKMVKKQERRVKELLSQADEEQKNKLQLLENVDQLQQKMKAFKRQAEDAVSVVKLHTEQVFVCVWSNFIN